MIHQYNWLTIKISQHQYLKWTYNHHRRLIKKTPNGIFISSLVTKYLSYGNNSITCSIANAMNVTCIYIAQFSVSFTFPAIQHQSCVLLLLIHLLKFTTISCSEYWDKCKEIMKNWSETGDFPQNIKLVCTSLVGKVVKVLSSEILFHICSSPCSKI